MVIPVVALKNIVVLPGMLTNFDVARRSGVAAIEHAMKEDGYVLLVSQRNADTETPGFADLYTVGTIAHIRQMLRLPGNVVRVLTVGEKRARISQIVANQPYIIADIEIYSDEENEIAAVEEEAMLRSMREFISKYSNVNTQINKSVYKQLLMEGSITKLLEQIAIQIPMNVGEKQRLLEANDCIERYKITAAILLNEIDVIRIKNELQTKVQARVEKNQREYYMREQLKVIREELGETDSVTEAQRYIDEAMKLNASEQVKEKIKKEIERFRNMSGSSSESAVCRGYIETLLSLPWDRVSQDKLNLKNAKRILDRDHYGLDKVKDRMLEFLAVRGLTQKGESPIICLIGPPGTGKTSIAKSVAEALNKRYVRICLGGVRDEAEIRGHRRTYVGAMPGRIVMGLKNAGVKNPLMLLDEIDKVSSDYKGDTASALLEVLDSEQNERFVDHYIELPVDLTEVLFIATANSAQDIPRPLLDRMEVIEVNSYTANEKLHIAKEHLVAKQLRKNGLNKGKLSLTQKAIEHIISEYTIEAGVRSLERRLGEICRKAAREIVESGENTRRIMVTEKNLEHYLGRKKHISDKVNTKPDIGIVQGLAWTSVGGETLQIEVNTMPGKGNFELTGQLGDVMKESAKTGISFIRSVSSEYGIDTRFFEENDIHIHIPAGAVPKDGPSAGITMATAMISAITGKLVRSDVAMTGEITLRGRVLPVGGLKEKLLAAAVAGIKLVIVPEKNKPDIEDISNEIKVGLDIRYASKMSEVLELSICSNKTDTICVSREGENNDN